ncbi:hypothetical protein [Anatilimnocola floriformis]|uniref:hypothetical protein n=1 Tax=Anatilimnocola floriformis TaxID=2948575 RepID=UPI0020C373EF|nr:hypothetical protein [Anatilimnocola floriformis]
MNILSETLLPTLFRTAVMVAGMMLVMRAALWLLNIRHPVFHRWACVLILLQGWLIAPLVIAIPWYDPPIVTKTTQLTAGSPDFSLPGKSSIALPAATDHSPQSGVGCRRTLVHVFSIENRGGRYCWLFVVYGNARQLRRLRRQLPALLAHRSLPAPAH